MQHNSSVIAVVLKDGVELGKVVYYPDKDTYTVWSKDGKR